MGWLVNLKIALTALWVNKVRSFLTLLGIVIGISSIVTVVASGEGIQQFILGELQSFGTNVIGVTPGGSDDDQFGPPAAVLGVTVDSLTMDDVEALADPRNVPDVTSVGASTTAIQEVVKGVDGDEVVVVFGATPNYFDIQNLDFEEGIAYTNDDVRAVSKVVVLGDTIKQDLFGDESAVGKRIRLRNGRYRITGVLAESSGFSFGIDLGAFAYVPVTTSQKFLLGTDYVDELIIQVTDEDRVDRAREDVIATLRVEHDLREGDSNDFTVRTLKDAISVIEGVTGALTLFLAAIAAISLLVGGIGIMNIMLVSVTERTREIGLRKAIGARRRDILFQFLLEAVLLTLIGGIIGFIFGSLGAYGISIVGNWDFQISFMAVFLPFAMTTAFGIVFGLYPALRASRLDPIVALRYE
ncbi:MAG: ABC transporter permease [Patescibacteria group bacterium]|nr:ABC transporter permease [Patescibacteria group bacterium]